jgi:putative restriction endonuclease
MATRAEQIARLVEGLASAGLRVINDYDPNDRPVTLQVADAEAVRAFRVFCWNVTPGGHGRSADEFRVQTTRPGNVPLYMAGATTLVLGYEEDRDLFVAWDAEKHPNPGGSSSLQVSEGTLDEAVAQGFVGHARPISDDEVEVVVAFRPELIGEYLEIRTDLDATTPAESEASAEAASGNEEGALEELPAGSPRRRAVTRVSRLVRNGQFRSRVIRAYEQRCALCDLGAGLIQAAHIRSVSTGGEDQVRNGLAVCPTHHLAFDLGLLVLSDDLAISLNDRRLDELGVAADDRDRLRDGLRESVRVPDDPLLAPARENVAAHRDQWV